MPYCFQCSARAAAPSSSVPSFHAKSATTFSDGQSSVQCRNRTVVGHALWAKVALPVAASMAFARSSTCSQHGFCKFCCNSSSEMANCAQDLPFTANTGQQKEGRNLHVKFNLAKVKTDTGWLASWWGKSGLCDVNTQKLWVWNIQEYSYLSGKHKGAETDLVLETMYGAYCVLLNTGICQEHRGHFCTADLMAECLLRNTTHLKGCPSPAFCTAPITFL